MDSQNESDLNENGVEVSRTFLPYIRFKIDILHLENSNDIFKTLISMHILQNGQALLINFTSIN